MTSSYRNDYEAFLLKVHAVDSVMRDRLTKDVIREIEIEPGLFHVVGESGIIYATYGSLFRDQLRKIRENNNH